MVLGEKLRIYLYDSVGALAGYAVKSQRGLYELYDKKGKLVARVKPETTVAYAVKLILSAQQYIS